jgi:hemerythrin-like domain-containing protein
MTTIAHLREAHTQLLEMISDVKTGLTVENLKIKANAKAMHTLLCDVAVKVREHLGEEDKEMYPQLLKQGNALKHTAWNFIAGESELRKEFEAYYKKYLKDCKFELSTSFVDETNGILDAVLARIEREEKVLFPKLEEAGMFAAEQPVRSRA